jgi:phosphatidylglycerophosphate synthase
MGWWRNFKLKTRAAYKKVMLPVGRLIGKLGITPNIISLTSGIFGIATATMYAMNGRVGTSWIRNYWWLIGFALMVCTSFIDIIDGSVARATGQTTKFGQVLDPVMDRFAEFCFLIGITIGNYSFAPLGELWPPITTIPIAAWCMFTFAGMIFASYSRTKGENVAKESVESVGIMERREKLALLFLGNLLYYWYPVALVFSIALVGVLSFITTVQRMLFIRKLFQETDNTAQVEIAKESNTLEKEASKEQE